MMRIGRILGAGLVAVTAIGGAGCKTRVSEAKAAPVAEAALPPVGDHEARHVETVTAEERSVPESLALSGTLDANRSSDVAADAAGKVAATYVERGTFVKKGAILARIDAASAGLAAAQAKADSEGARTDLELASDELARTERLHAQGALAEVELKRARARKEAAEQRVAGAVARSALQAKSLGDTAIRAPFDGLVADRWIDEGEYVRPDMRVVTLVDADTLRLKLFVPESAATRIAEGQEVVFTVASDPAQHVAKVRYVGAEVRPGSRELVAEALYDNTARKLRPGMFATAHLRLGERRAVVLPATALRKQGASWRAFVVKNGVLEERVVETADTRGDVVALKSGVAAGERVVGRIGPELRDGLRAQ